MAISTSAQVIETALWPQGDIRDPLGVWGARLLITGDASGGSIKVVAQVAADKKAAYMYTVYNTNLAVLSQATPTQVFGKFRILTNWPDIDPTVGVQGYGSTFISTIGVDPNFTAPVGGNIRDHWMGPNDRFLLLFDPRPIGIPLDLAELEFADNVLADTYAFEFYGYFWDRSVLNAPGGPRHPGSS